MEASAKLATEAINNIRCVAGLRVEKTFLDRYIAILRGYYNQSLSKSHTTGVIFGYAKCKMNLFAIAILLCCSSLMYNREVDQTAALVVIRSVSVACMVIGAQPKVASNFKKALAAAKLIFGCLDRQPRICLLYTSPSPRDS